MMRKTTWAESLMVEGASLVGVLRRYGLDDSWPVSVVLFVCVTNGPPFNWRVLLVELVGFGRFWRLAFGWLVQQLEPGLFRGDLVATGAVHDRSKDDCQQEELEGEVQHPVDEG